MEKLNMAEIRRKEAGAVRAISEGTKRVLEVLAAPFGSPDRLDRYNQYLSPNTDFMIEVGDKRPLLYFHGNSPRGRMMDVPQVIGPPAEVTRIDSQGIWMRAELWDGELQDKTWEAALQGKARASTGSIGYLVRPQPKDGKYPKGEVRVWAIAELSVFDALDGRVPVSDDAIAMPLRGVYEQSGLELPEGFEVGENKEHEDNEKSTRTIKLDNLGDKQMDKKEIKDTVVEALSEIKSAELKAAQDREAIRAELLEEMKGEKKYRSTFNINKIDDSEAKKNAGDEEEFAFYRGIIEDAKRVAVGGLPRGYRAAASLEETEADELGDLVPDQLMNKIYAKLQEYSVVDKLASKGLMTIHKADRLTISAPQNVTHMTALADISEEGAYTQQVPTFDAKQATMQKVGNYVTVTEEGLDDQTLFQSWFPAECARAVALSKNADLYALTNAIAGTDVATRNAITTGELLAARYGIEQQYREGAIWLMSDDTLAYLRGLRDANNFVYGDAGFAPWNGFGELGETLLGKPIFCNANWEAISGADAADKVIDFLNMDQAIFWAERKKLSIFVDPYSTRIAAGTINFLPMARYGGVVKDSEAMYGIDGKDA